MISKQEEDTKNVSIKVVKENYFYVHDWDEADWFALIDSYEMELKHAEEFGKAFLRAN